jgi:phosphoribosylglycinamide formyltransferase-1
MKNVGILISGRGSNMVALIEAMRSGAVKGRPALVVSNDPTAQGLVKARSYGAPTAVVANADFKGQGREAHDRAVAAALDAAGVEIVCLAGYMRVLTPWFVEHFKERLINVHPALLPSYPGLHGQKQALDWGARISGCTVHFVDAEVDHGPIIAQAPVPVLPGDDEDALSARILEQEHRIYPLALALLCAGRLRIEARKVVVADERFDPPGSLVAPRPEC